MENYVTLKEPVTYKHATENALLFVLDGEEFWCPRSLLSWKCDRAVEKLKRGQEFELELLEWKAKMEGWEYE